MKVDEWNMENVHEMTQAMGRIILEMLDRCRTEGIPAVVMWGELDRLTRISKKELQSHPPGSEPMGKMIMENIEYRNQRLTDRTDPEGQT